MNASTYKRVDTRHKIQSH